MEQFSPLLSNIACISARGQGGESHGPQHSACTLHPAPCLHHSALHFGHWIWPAQSRYVRVQVVLGGSHLTVTASQSQHRLVSTLLNSTNSYSTLLDFNTSAFNNSCIQHYSDSTSTYSTYLAFNTSCIQQLLYSTLLDFNNHGFKYPCFQHTLDSTSIVFNKYT